MLVWLDLETTGLAASKCSILEVAAVVTDDDFHEVARTQFVVYFPYAAAIVEMLDAGVDHKSIGRATGAINPIDPYVVNMHAKNGLWRDCVKGIALDTVDRELASFVKQHAVRVEEKIVQVPDGNGPGFETRRETILPQLAGSTISFDRAFIGAHLPRLAATLHYRNLDASSLNELAKRQLPDLYRARPNAGRSKEDATHRGMADILESIDLVRHYTRAFTRAVSAWVSNVAPVGDLVRP